MVVVTVIVTVAVTTTAMAIRTVTVTVIATAAATVTVTVTVLVIWMATITVTEAVTAGRAASVKLARLHLSAVGGFRAVVLSLFRKRLRSSLPPGLNDCFSETITRIVSQSQVSYGRNVIEKKPIGRCHLQYAEPTKLVLGDVKRRQQQPQPQR